MKVFEIIKCVLITSKQFFDVWIKCLIKETDHIPLDVVILLIMISVNDEKCIYIENIFRRKIKTQQFTISLIQSTIRDLSIVIVHYKKNFLELIENFFRDRDVSVSTFGYCSYKMLFGVPNCDTKLILSKLIGFVSERPHTSPFTASIIDNDISTHALHLLTEMNRKNPLEMQTNGLQLLRILDRVCELNLSQFRLVMNILCSVAYPLPPLSPSDRLQDHIDMLVKKQVTSSIALIKHRGIIGATRVVDHIIWTEKAPAIPMDDESTDLDLTFNSVDEIPDGVGRTSAKLIELILTSTSNCVESLSLCFDELASIFSNKISYVPKRQPHLDRNFHSWICDTITNDFQTYFVDEMIPSSELDLGYQYCINTPEENSETTVIAINIGATALQKNSSACSSIQILPSLFNLLRVLHFRRYDGSLESINAVLGCSIILPTTILMGEHSNCDIFDEFDDVKSRQLMDMHYYTANWFREVISAFANQNDEVIRKKVLQRLSQLIELEETIRGLLKKAPSDYSPPQCQFNKSDFIGSGGSKFKKPAAVPSASTSKRRGSASKRKVTIPVGDTEGVLSLANNESLVNVSNLSKGGKSTKSSVKYNSGYGPKEIYRQMDPDLMLLLKEKLVIQVIIPAESFGDHLGLLEFQFIIEDLVNKLESVNGSKKSINDQRTQFIISPNDLINDLTYFLDRILSFIEQLSNHLENAVTKGVNLFSDELNRVKICYGLCLRLIAGIFTWNRFNDDEHLGMLKKCLKIIGKQSNNEDDDVKDLAQSAFENTIKFQSTILNLSCAVNFYHLMKVLAIFVNETATNAKVIDICLKFLSQKWYGFEGSLESGANCNILLDELLKGLFNNPSLSIVQTNAEVIVAESKLITSKNKSLKEFPCINT